MSTRALAWIIFALVVASIAISVYIIQEGGWPK